MMENSNLQSISAFGTGRFIFLGLASVALCMSFFMTIFTPLPLALVAIVYGRNRALLLGAACSILAWLWGSTMIAGQAMFLAYVAGWGVAIIISEMVFRKISPMKGLVKSGFVVISVIGAISLFAVTSLDKPLKMFLTENVKDFTAKVIEDNKKMFERGDENSRKILDLFAQPELIATEIIRVYPSYMFIAVFFTLWINLLLMLKGLASILSDKGYTFSDKDLLSFKMPDYFVWLVVLGLVLFLGDDLLGLGFVASTIGLTLLQCLGLFYFFQGVGIYVAFLNGLGIGNFFKSFLIMFLIVTIPWILAIVGLFDMWINFRKLFDKKNSENKGDKL